MLPVLYLHLETIDTIGSQIRRYIEEEWSPQASAHESQNGSRGSIFTLRPAATIVQEGDGMSFLEDSDSWIIFEIYAISTDFHSDLVHFLGRLTDRDRLWNVDEVTNETQSGEICRVRWTSYRQVGASIFRPIEQNVY